MSTNPKIDPEADPDSEREAAFLRRLATQLGVDELGEEALAKALGFDQLSEQALVKSLGLDQLTDAKLDDWFVALMSGPSGEQPPKQATTVTQVDPAQAEQRAPSNRLALPPQKRRR
jgi:hypothetical protein